MARITYSALVSTINGSIAGTTFQRNAYGHSVKKKPTIVNPNRLRQSVTKTNMQVTSQAWRNLTPAVRSAWAAYALAFPVPSRLNPNANLSGQALFTRVQLLRLLEGFTTNTAAPTMVADNLVAGTVEVNRVGATLIYFNDSDSNLNNLRTIGYISGRVGASVQFDSSRTRFMSGFQLIAADQVDITAQCTSQFGALPNTSDHIFLKYVYYNPANGQVITVNPTNIVVG